jgi:hypothetical protein
MSAAMRPDIPVNLGSGTPCRNDDIEDYSPKLSQLRGEQPNTETVV